MGFYMRQCTDILLWEIEEGVSQKDVAVTFAAAMRTEKAGLEEVDWGLVGQAALERWGPAGWKRVKDRGWRIYEGRIKV
jgi:hypothetical protein